jgi:hypothetical protein
MAAAFLAAYGFIWFLGGIPALLGAAGLGAFFGLLGLSLRAESKGAGHIRFAPVPIRPPPFRHVFRFSMMIPFACAALGSLFSPFLAGAGFKDGPGRREDAGTVSSLDYERHLAFQRSFSLLPLGQGPAPETGDFNAFKDPPYLRYYIGDDGLIGGTGEYPEEPGPDAPPFPLEDLMSFAGGFGNVPAYAPGDVVSVLIVLGFCVFPLLRAGWNHRKKKKMVVYHDKRIAA